MKKICVIGLGYIGIPTSVMFASRGYEVIGIDIRKEIVDLINKGILPVEEPGLNELFKDSKLKAFTKPQQADVYIIAVGTPINKDHTVNLDAVKSAASSIVSYINKNTIVILESTVPPGTTDEVVAPILEQSGLKAGQDFYLVHSPERVIPGNIMHELVNNERIIGGITLEGAQLAKELYSSFVKGAIHTTDARTAETAKLMENTYRNVNIALANELSSISENLGINAWEVISLANRHPRVNILNPGPGVGGHCIPVDPWFIVEKCPEQANIIKLALEKNKVIPSLVAQKIYNITAKKKGLKICLLGVTYKADTDDVRESPIFELHSILKENNEVTIYDPHVKKYSQIDLYECAKDCNITVLCVNHSEFKDIDYAKLSKVMKNKIILDTRNFINKDQLSNAGFKYYILGNGKEI